MLNMEKPCTEIPKLQDCCCLEESDHLKSKDVLTQTIRPPPFPLEVDRSLRITG